MKPQMIIKGNYSLIWKQNKSGIKFLDVYWLRVFTTKYQIPYAESRKSAIANAIAQAQGEVILEQTIAHRG